MNANAHRECYRPCGRCDLSRLALLLPVAAVWSGVVGAFFFLLVSTGYYFLAMAVLLPAAFTAGVVGRLVRWSHCRNRLLAAVIGGSMSLAGYVAYLHADQCLRWDMPWTAIGRLPGYVAFRMETDRWQFLDKGALLRPQQPAAGVVPWRPIAPPKGWSLNWFMLLFDASVLVLVPLATGVYAAGLPYSESRRRWCETEKLILSPESAAALREALIHSQIGDWVLSRPQKVGEHEPHAVVSVWYTPREAGADVDWDVFVCVGSGPRWRLTAAEAADLTVLLPELQDVAQQAEARLAADASSEGGGARIRPVLPSFAGRAQNIWTVLAGKAIIQAAMIGPGLVAVALLPGGVGLLTLAAQRFAWLPAWAIVIYVVGVGLGLLALIRYWHNPERPMSFELGRRFDYWLMRRAIRQRPAPQVSADDPEAVFVEMSPRRLWGRGYARPGEFNQGLLALDWEAERLLLEGDYHCYEIPAAAILDCQIEGMPGVGANTGGLFAVVLQVQVGQTVWEAPLFPLYAIEGSNNWQRAVALLEGIQSLCGRQFAEELSQPPAAPPIGAV
jgi:hypothetical protein